MSTQENQWSVIADLLRRAGDEIGRISTACGAATAADIPREAQAQVAMFLENNELGLAWDELASMADETGAPATFWQDLLLAAGLMSCGERAHLAAMRLCNVGPHTARAS